MLEENKRLTHYRQNGIKNSYWSPDTKDTLIQRLAAYENLGYTPLELASQLKQLHILEDGIADIMSQCDQVDREREKEVVW